MMCSLCFPFPPLCRVIFLIDARKSDVVIPKIYLRPRRYTYDRETIKYVKLKESWITARE